MTDPTINFDIDESSLDIENIEECLTTEINGLDAKVTVHPEDMIVTGDADVTVTFDSEDEREEGAVVDRELGGPEISMIHKLEAIINSIERGEYNEIGCRNNYTRGLVDERRVVSKLWSYESDSSELDLLIDVDD